jgi:hypothetical protein
MYRLPQPAKLPSQLRTARWIAQEGDFARQTVLQRRQIARADFVCRQIGLPEAVLQALASNQTAPQVANSIALALVLEQVSDGESGTAEGQAALREA